MIRPQPVLTSASITAALHAAAIIIGFLGFNQAENAVNDNTATLVSIALGIITLAAHLIPALHASKAVTPLANPVTADGTPLLPATTLTDASGVFVPARHPSPGPAAGATASASKAQLAQLAATYARLTPEVTASLLDEPDPT